VLLFGGGFRAQADAPAPQGATAAPAAAGSAAAGADAGEPKSLPQDGLFSSIKQSLREGDQEIIRGHFEVGSPPNVHRYYCLMDPKSHRREPNGVVGDPIPRADGMTGIKSSAVSLYRCDKAEQQGMLVTAGYVVPARSAGPGASADMPPPPPPAVVAAAPPPSTPPVAPPAAAPVSRYSSGMVDISGVRLGMSADEVRAALKSQNLRDHNEWSENLSYRDTETGKMQPVANGRFINVIAASNSVLSAAEGNYETDGESFEVMFTPVPGRERAMAIVHTVGYSPSNAVHESALEQGLIEKYGGFVGAGSLPQSATWLYRAGGSVAVGDDCGRRGMLGGLGALRVARARENMALQRSSEELDFEIQHCGIAIVTEDHYTANGGALRGDRMVTRYTVTAYSPALAADGAAQAETILRAAEHNQGRAVIVPAKDAHVPDL
jgi:hypothetical protein